MMSYPLSGYEGLLDPFISMIRYSVTPLAAVLSRIDNSIDFIACNLTSCLILSTLSFHFRHTPSLEQSLHKQTSPPGRLWFIFKLPTASFCLRHGKQATKPTNPTGVRAFPW